MRNLVAFISFVVLAGCNSVGESPSQTEIKSDIPPIVIEYFNRLDAIYHSGSSKSDVTNFLALMTDDVRYVHRNYGADFDLKSWNEAFTRIQTNGGYNKSDQFCTAISNSIPGNSYYAIEYAVGLKLEGQCVASKAERMLVVFKFNEQKIQLIEELW